MRILHLEAMLPFRRQRPHGASCRGPPPGTLRPVACFSSHLSHAPSRLRAPQAAPGSTSEAVAVLRASTLSLLPLLVSSASA